MESENDDQRNETLPEHERAHEENQNQTTMPDYNLESDYILKPPPPKSAPPENIARKPSDINIESGSMILASSAKYRSSKSPKTKVNQKKYTN